MYRKKKKRESLSKQLYSFVPDLFVLNYSNKTFLSKANDIKYIIKNPNIDQIYSFVC